MAKVLVPYYSACGHLDAMANAVAEGARGAGAEVDIKRVPELAPEEIARKRTTSSTRLLRWQRSKTSPITTPLLWRRHALRP
jgi:hypothetical protein